MRLAVVGVEAHQLLIFVGLVLLDGFAIFLVGVSLAVNVFEKSEVFRLVVEVGFRENAVVDEEFEVVPLFFKLSAVALEERRKTVCHLLGDVLRNLLHIAVALEIRTTHVERNVRTVDDPMQECQEVGHNVFHRISDKHLVAIELNLIAMDFDVVFNLWEIQNTREIERIVHIEVNPEERFILHGIEIAIEIAIILISQGRRRLCPERVSVVDHVVLSGVHLLSIFPLLLLAKGNGDGEEAAVFVEQSLDATLFEEFLVFLVNVQHDVRTAFRLFGWFECEFGSAVATPFHSFRTFAVALGHDVYATRHHKRRIEAQTEVANDGGRIVFVFFEEVSSSRESDLVDIAVNLFCRHTNTLVADGECASFFVNVHRHFHVCGVAIEFALTG